MSTLPLVDSALHPKLVDRNIFDTIIPMLQRQSLITARDLETHNLTQDTESFTLLTARSGGSSINVSPTKPKKSIIRINHKNLPQDFFNFGTSKIYNRQVNNKAALSPNHSNKPEPDEVQGLWLPNFGEQALFGEEGLIISDEAELRRIRNRLGRGLIKTKEDCHSPLIPSYKTIGAMTPCPSTGGDSPMTDPTVFEWTFSRDMYVSMSPTKPTQQRNQIPLRRGNSVREKPTTESFLARSCEQDSSLLISRIKRRKSSMGSSRAASQLPRIARRNTPYH